MNDDVFRVLSAAPVRALDVARTLNTDKSIANRALYELERQGLVCRLDGTPPLWKRHLEAASSAQTSNKSQRESIPSSPASGSTVAQDNVKATISHSCGSRISADASHAAEDSESEAWAQQCADAVWRAFDAAKPNISGKKQVVAGFVLREHAGSARVVALGSGTKSIAGDRLSLQGLVVHDSHAEIIARRSLLRWLYSELDKASNGSASVAALSPKGPFPFSLLPMELWLYVSVAPCGDSAIFSNVDPEPSAAGSGAAWSNPKHGVLRTKIEAGQGTVPVAPGTEQTFDGLQRGDRLRCHSCSDKIAKWAVTGVQGALLSRLIGPLYLRGVVVGDKFSRTHVCRALCCRSLRALDFAEVTLEAPYRGQHFEVLHAPSNSTRHHAVQKTCSSSMNWAEQDAIHTAEETDCRTGLRNDEKPSQISKASLFCHFCRFLPGSASFSYIDNKVAAAAYRKAKHAWVMAMAAVQFGQWACKPVEINQFCLPS